MGILGKDLTDLDRPDSHVKVQFGEKRYWIEYDVVGLPYGSILVAALNTEGEVDTPFACSTEDIVTIQERYAWFLEEALDDGGQRRKKGQRKLPAAERMVSRGMDAFVSGRSLGKDTNVDAPNVQLQYAVLETPEGTELVEKMYFDSLLDFVYVELMKGLQKGFIPKRCLNCGRWFLQEPGMDFNYCAGPAPQDPTVQCRDLGARSSFLEKKKNHAIWNIHQRAYRKYYARLMKHKMEKEVFFRWAEEAAQLRDKLLPQYAAAPEEERAAMAEVFRKEINQL